MTRTYLLGAFPVIIDPKSPTFRRVLQYIPRVIVFGIYSFGSEIDLIEPYMQAEPLYCLRASRTKKNCCVSNRRGGAFIFMY